MIDKLDFVILKYLISYIDLNVDRCCFALTCKRLYNSRNKYLHFNIGSLYFHKTFLHHLTKYYSCSSIIGGFRDQAIQSLLSSSDDIRIVDIKLKDEENRLDKTIPYEINSDAIRISYDLCLHSLCLPSNLRVLEFGLEFNQVLQPNTLPSTLQILRFGRDYNQPLFQNVLPSSLVQLVFGMNFNQPLERNMIPDNSNLEYIEFGINFQQPIPDGVLTVASKLNTLIFKGKFNEPLTNISLPNTIKTLKLSKQFNQPLVGSMLPTSLTSLTLGECYAQPFDGQNSFPASLEKLYLTHSNISGSLPDSIKTLDIYNEYYYKVDALPAINENFTMPTKLEHLYLYIASGSIYVLYPQLPITLITLVIQRDSVKLPPDAHLPNLKKLSLLMAGIDSIMPNQLPDSIEELCIQTSCIETLFTKGSIGYPHYKIDNWSFMPKSLKQLYVTNRFLTRNSIPFNIDLIYNQYYMRRLDKDYILILRDNLQGGITKQNRFINNPKHYTYRYIAVKDENK